MMLCQVKAAGLSKPSVLDAKRDPGRFTEQKFQQDALVGEDSTRQTIRPPCFDILSLTSQLTLHA